jgi:hypothetical protein
VKYIQLKCGATFTVDDEDFERVAAHRWCLSGNKHIMRYTKGENPLGVYVHHFIIGQPLKPWQTDHIDRNPLNNCKSNLRNVPQWLNSANRGLRTNNTSGKTGVYRKRDKWCARDYHSKSLGSFGTKEQAIEARREYEAKI